MSLISNLTGYSRGWLVGLCLLGAGMLPGCDAGSSSFRPGAAAPVLKPDPVEIVRSLESAQAVLRRTPDGRVQQVAFTKAPATDAEVGALIQLESLQTLIISNSELTLAGWKELGLLKKLRTLDLRDCKVGDAQFAAAVSGMNELVIVRMNGKNGATTVSDEGIVALKNCPKLQVLAADFLFISDTGIEALSGLKSLSELYLANSLVDDVALERIAAIPSITKLRVAKTSIGKTGLDKLTALELEELDISECSNVDDTALEPVGKLKSLKKLNLWRDAIGDNGVVHLKDLVNLEWLNVDNTQLSDAGLKSFAAFDKLKFLHLGSTGVSDAGMPDILPMKSLTELKVSRTSVTEAGVEPLRKAMPKLDVQLKYGRDVEP